MQSEICFFFIIEDWIQVFYALNYFLMCIRAGRDFGVPGPRLEVTAVRLRISTAPLQGSPSFSLVHSN